MWSDSRKKKKLVNVISTSPENFDRRSGSNLHRHQGGGHFLASAVGTARSLGCCWPNQGKAGGFDGIAGKP